MGIDLQVLGSGTSAPSADRSCAAYAFRTADGLGLLDCGPGTVRRLAEAGIDTNDIRWILLTHRHVDHCADLAPLLFWWHAPESGRTLPLEIHGPVETVRYWEGLRRIYGDWIVPACPVEVREWSCGEFRLGEGTAVRTAPTAHSTPTVAYRIEAGGASLAFSGDTGPCDAVADLAKGADLFVLECALPEEMRVPTHMTPSDCGRMAAAAGCGHLLLTHFYPPVERVDIPALCRAHYRGPVTLAKDLLRARIESGRVRFGVGA